MRDLPETKLFPLNPEELGALLRRRESILVADERAAVQAALAQATPEEREELLRLLGHRQDGG